MQRARHLLLRLHAAPFALAWLLAQAVAAPAPPIDAPGFRPRSAGYHALTGATAIPAPGLEITNATLVVSNGIIISLQSGGPIPEGARRWDVSGLTLYPGLFEPYLVQNLPPSPGGNPSADGPTDDLAAADVETGPRFLGVPGQERDPGGAGPGAFSRRITPEARIAASYSPNPKTIESLHDLGFTAAQVVPGEGIFRGQSAVVSLAVASPNRTLLRLDHAQCIGFDPASTPSAAEGSASGAYPGSLMGVIAVVRQSFLDADYHAALRAHAAAHPQPGTRPIVHLAWDALAAVRAGQPVLFDAGSVLMLHRAAGLARELGIGRTIFLATGQEWRRPDLIAKAGGPFILPIAFPALPKITDDADWTDISLDQLRAWDWAPETPLVLERAHVPFALSTHGLGDRKEFRKNLRTALDRGLSESNALAALTVTAAEIAGVSDRLGTLTPGKIANLTLTDGSYFHPTSRVHAVWVDGVPHVLTQAAREPDTARTASATAVDKKGDKEDPPKLPPLPAPPVARAARAPLEFRGAVTNPPAVIVRHATLWTSGPQGTISNATLVVRDGRILSVGPEPSEPIDGALVIDGTGLHVTPGLIDCHSHSAILGSVNEATLPSTAMVRIEDVLNSESPELQRQLAGGLTTANLLHGSANPIGGQNAVIKLRDGAAPEDLLFAGAPPGIKFALGENVKQANWGDRQVTRFPQSRMGVPTFYVNRFTAAQRALADRRARAASGRPDALPPMRRDLELEAIGEILEGKRLIHCHSYRQDEILAFLRTMESFGVRVATLQHILEGYKVADEIARHGAGASSFADWWAYKYEVIDAIPYAGSLMRERGVTVSFNSDSSDHARRLNFEAAKAVKYGNTPEVEALRFVTLNPAKQLRIDERVGSLERGKDADFAIWSGNPLDSRSLCLQTWIDGRQYFDRAAQEVRTRGLDAERTALIDKAKKSRTPGGASEPSAAARARFFQRAWEQASHLGVSECLDCAISQRP